MIWIAEKVEQWLNLQRMWNNPLSSSVGEWRRLQRGEDQHRWSSSEAGQVSTEGHTQDRKWSSVRNTCKYKIKQEVKHTKWQILWNNMHFKCIYIQYVCDNILLLRIQGHTGISDLPPDAFLAHTRSRSRKWAHIEDVDKGCTLIETDSNPYVAAWLKPNNKKEP